MTYNHCNIFNTCKNKFYWCKTIAPFTVFLLYFICSIIFRQNNNNNNNHKILDLKFWYMKHDKGNNLLTDCFKQRNKVILKWQDNKLLNMTTMLNAISQTVHPYWLYTPQCMLGKGQRVLNHKILLKKKLNVGLLEPKRCISPTHALLAGSAEKYY